MNYFIALLIAVIWGYFRDLRQGQYDWFAGRIIFMLAFAFIADNLFN